MSARRSLARSLAVAAFALVGLAGVAPAAGGAPPRPELSVVGGDASWHADNRIVLRLGPSVPGGEPPAAAVRYLLRGPTGNLVVDEREVPLTGARLAIKVPKTPGAYTAELRYVEGDGTPGPVASATLRYDGVRPGPVPAPHVPRWIGRNDFPLAVSLGPADGRWPLSGIAGYAASTRAGEDAPCAAARCTDAEIDVRGAAGVLHLTSLPEGRSVLRAVAVSGAGLASHEVTRVPLDVDTAYPSTRLLGAPAGWSNGPVRLTALASDADSGMEADGGRPPFTAIRIGGGAPVVAKGDSVSTTLIAEGVHSVAHYARDAAGNVADGSWTNGRRNRGPARATVRIDRSAPRLRFIAQDPADPELIRARVSDRLSGPNRSRGWIEVRRAGSGDRFARLPTAAAGRGGLSARWDSDSYPPGRYEFRATGFDAAGNRGSSNRRAGGAAMVLRNPLKAPTVLRIGFGGRTLTWRSCARRGGRVRCRRRTVADFARRPSRRAVPYGRRVRFGGRLRTARGLPLAGRAVRVVERLAGGAGPTVRTTTARTRRDGSFSLRLGAGPSRRVTARFEGDSVLGRTAARPVRLDVRSVVRLRASARLARIGGRPLVFAGRLVAPPGAIPVSGAAVQLQFRLPGLRWSGFRTVRTDRRGRFRYPYRFSDDDSRGVRFQFRAHVPAQDGWPYEPGGSRPVAVRGT